MATGGAGLRRAQKTRSKVTDDDILLFKCRIMNAMIMGKLIAIYNLFRDHMHSIPLNIITKSSRFCV